MCITQLLEPRNLLRHKFLFNSMPQQRALLTSARGEQKKRVLLGLAEQLLTELCGRRWHAAAPLVV